MSRKATEEMIEGNKMHSLEHYKAIWYGVTLFSLIVVLIGLANVGINQVIDRTLTTNFKTSATTQTQIIEKSINQFLEQVFNDIDMVSNFPSFRDVGNGLTDYTQKPAGVMDSTKGSEEEAHLFSIMSIYGNSHPGTLYVYLATNNGGYLCWPSTKLPAHYDPRVRPWYLAAIEAKGKTVQTSPYIDLATGNLIISNVKAIYDSDNVLKGVVGIDVSMDQMANVVNDVKVKDSFFILVHKSGLILTDTSSVANNFKYLDDVYPELKSVYQTGETDNVLVGKDRYMVYSDRVDETQWHILVLTKRQALYNQAEGYIRNLTYGTIAVVFILMLTILGVSYILFYNRALQKMVSIRTQDLQTMIDELIHKDTDLRVSETRLRSLIENIPGIVYRCHPKAPWYMLTISNWVEIITGYEASTFTSESAKPWVDLVHPDDLECVMQVDAQQVGEYFEVEYRIVTKSGEIKWVFERGGLIADADGSVYMDGVIIDITDRKMVEQEVHRLYEEMEHRVASRTEDLKNAMSQLMEQEKMASLGGIVSGVAHEINTPLGISVTIASYLKKISDELGGHLHEGTLSKSKLKDFIHQNAESYDILQTNLSRAAELVNSFKKISVNQTSEERVTFYLKEYIDMILLSLKHEYKNKGFDIRVACDENIEIYSYPGAFSQILTNLLMNSFIHGFKDRQDGQVEIVVNVNVREDRLNLDYTDNGSGMDRETLEHIFEPFFTTNRANGGSGLGLYIVYNLISQKLNGTISCMSTMGEGTTFKLSFPLSTLKAEWQEKTPE